MMRLPRRAGSAVPQNKNIFSLESHGELFIISPAFAFTSILHPETWRTDDEVRNFSTRIGVSERAYPAFGYALTSYGLRRVRACAPRNRSRPRTCGYRRHEFGNQRSPDWDPLGLGNASCSCTGTIAMHDRLLALLCPADEGLACRQTSHPLGGEGWHDQTFNIATGTAITTVRDMVVTNLQQAGWSVSTSGNAVIINGHNNGGAVSGPTEVNAQAPKYTEKGQPAISSTDGVKVGQVLGSSSPWAVSFVPLDNTNPTMTEDATFSLTVDSTTVNVNLTSGMTVSQAAQALYNAMVSAGFQGVSLISDGTGVTFFNSTSGSFAINVNESWNDNSTDPSSSGGGLSAMIDIANVTIIQ